VAQGKRQQDRAARLSPGLVPALRASWRVSRPDPWLFPGRDGPQPRARTTASLIFPRAKDRAAMTQPGGRPLLRHACAPHL
jgi:integrase/recombinase XerD